METFLKKGYELYSMTYWSDGSSNCETYKVLYIKRGRLNE
jgi:hypothetical protein